MCNTFIGTYVHINTYYSVHVYSYYLRKIHTVWEGLLVGITYVHMFGEFPKTSDLRFYSGNNGIDFGCSAIIPQCPHHHLKHCSHMQSAIEVMIYNR